MEDDKMTRWLEYYRTVWVIPLWLTGTWTNREGSIHSASTWPDRPLALAYQKGIVVWSQSGNGNDGRSQPTGLIYH